MRSLVVVAAACASPPATTPAGSADPGPVIELASAAREPGLRAVELWSAVGTADGGLVVAGRSYRGITLGGTSRCGAKDEGSFVARFDPAGHARWVRCLAVEHGVVAASESTVWLVRNVDPNLPEHVHGDTHDVAVVDRLSAADGTSIDTRVVVVWRGDPSTSSGEARAAAVKLGAAIVAGNEVLVAGASKRGAMVGGVWELRGYDTTLHGFVLGIGDAGTRSVVDGPDMVIDHIAVANGAYVATGWCSGSHPPSTGVVSCAGAGTQTMAITGDIDGRTPPHGRAFGADTYDMKGAIDDDGGVVVAASSWGHALVIDGTAVTSTCAKFAFAAAWTRAGALRFARALGDCKQPHVSKFALDGRASSMADDDISEHMLGVFDVAIVDHRPVVAIDVGEETNHLDWPVHVDELPIALPFGRDGLVVALDERGRVVHHRQLRFSSRAASSDQPDASLASRVGVQRVVIAPAGKRAWIVAEHRGSLETAGHRFLAGTALPDEDSFGSRRRRRSCDAHAIRDRPDIDAMVDDIQHGAEPEDFGCRRAVVADQAVVAMPIAAP